MSNDHVRVRSWPGRLGWVAIAALSIVACAVVATVLAGRADRSDAAPSRSTGSDDRARSSATAPTARPTRGVPVPAPHGTARHRVPAGLRPVRIDIPAIGVRADVTDLGIDRSGAIEVPRDWREAGWLDTTPAPGQQGPAVVAGHVDSTSGPAVFYRLGSLDVGDRVVVTRRDGSTVRFTVDGVKQYAKNRFPTRETYGPVPGPALRLITCGGPYVESRGGYQDNVVVFAS